MEVGIKKKAVTPFVIFLGFITMGVNSLIKGIEQHQPWRIAAAATGCLIFLGMTILLAYAVYKKKEQ